MNSWLAVEGRSLRHISVSVFYYLLAREERRRGSNLVENIQQDWRALCSKREGCAPPLALFPSFLLSLFPPPFFSFSFLPNQRCILSLLCSSVAFYPTSYCACPIVSNPQGWNPSVSSSFLPLSFSHFIFQLFFRSFVSLCFTFCTLFFSKLVIIPPLFPSLLLLRESSLFVRLFSPFVLQHQALLRLFFLPLFLLSPLAETRGFPASSFLFLFTHPFTRRKCFTPTCIRSIVFR